MLGNDRENITKSLFLSVPSEITQREALKNGFSAKLNSHRDSNVFLARKAKSTGKMDGNDQNINEPCKDRMNQDRLIQEPHVTRWPLSRSRRPRIISLLLL